jgi:uncharacterized membrane protein
MQKVSFPGIVFILLALFATAHFFSYYQQLPAIVASHFDAHGVPNGWQSKTAFLSVFVAVSLLSALTAFGLPFLITLMPMQTINLPNKEYWLGPEQREESLKFLRSYFAWFGCAVYWVIIFAFDYALKSNLYPKHPPDISSLWIVLAGFTGFAILSTIRMIMRFAKLPNDPGISGTK